MIDRPKRTEAIESALNDIGNNLLGISNEIDLYFWQMTINTDVLCCFNRRQNRVADSISRLMDLILAIWISMIYTSFD